MISNTIRLSRQRYFALTLLCGVGLSALCACAKQSQPAASVQPVAVNTPPKSTAPGKSEPVTLVPAKRLDNDMPHVAAYDHDLPNFHAVTPVLFRGAAPTGAGLEKLKEMGIKTVIDLRIAPKTVAKEHEALDKMGLTFVNYPLAGDIPPTDAQIQAFLKIITDPTQQPVFVHCQHGADRTGTMIGIYRERLNGWAYARTYKEMLKYGFDPKWTKLSDVVKRYSTPATP